MKFSMSLYEIIVSTTILLNGCLDDARESHLVVDWYKVVH